MIIIEDKKGDYKIRFKDIQKSIESDIEHPIFLDVLVHANLSCAEIKLKTTYELSDIEGLLSNLKILNSGLQKVFHFQHNDDYIKIKFFLTNNNDIIISGYITCKDYKMKTTFEFVTNQSFIRQVIEQCEIELMHLR